MINAAQWLYKLSFATWYKRRLAWLSFNYSTKLLICKQFAQIICFGGMGLRAVAVHLKVGRNIRPVLPSKETGKQIPLHGNVECRWAKHVQS